MRKSDFRLLARLRRSCEESIATADHRIALANECQRRFGPVPEMASAIVAARRDRAQAARTLAVVDRIEASGKWELIPIIEESA